MTEPDWKDVTPQPLGYVDKRDAEILSALSDGRCVSLYPPTDPVCMTERERYVPVYLAPMPQQQHGQPQEYMVGLSDEKARILKMLQQYRAIAREDGIWTAEDVLGALERALTEPPR